MSAMKTIVILALLAILAGGTYAGYAAIAHVRAAVAAHVEKTA